MRSMVPGLASHKKALAKSWRGHPPDDRHRARLGIEEAAYRDTEPAAAAHPEPASDADFP
jgi:hypothetical protein